MKDSLEEAAERYWAKQPYNEDAFIEGAKWQQEQSYTEQDMLDYVLYVELVHARYHYKAPLLPKEWFKQIKSKQDE